MAYFGDLEHCDYFGAEHAHALRAVGWLSPGYAFPTGEVPQRFMDRLQSHWRSWCAPHFPAFLGGIFAALAAAAPHLGGPEVMWEKWQKLLEWGRRRGFG